MSSDESEIVKIDEFSNELDNQKKNGQLFDTDSHPSQSRSASPRSQSQNDNQSLQDPIFEEIGEEDNDNEEVKETLHSLKTVGRSLNNVGWIT